jgi:hypothetical protein
MARPVVNKVPSTTGLLGFVLLILGGIGDAQPQGRPPLRPLSRRLDVLVAQGQNARWP